MGETRGEGKVDLLRAAVLGMSGLFVAFFVVVVALRFRAPIDLEWMTGAVLDHVERVKEGRPLYAAPSARWIPFLYPPLYYWASAWVARLCSILIACRIVSIAATLVAAASVGRLAHRLGATRFWVVTAVGLFFAAYSFTGYWYDLERTDTLTLALVAVSTVIAVESRTARGAAVAGAVAGLAFFAKQPAAAFVISGTIGFAIAGSRKQAIAYGASAAVVLGTVAYALSRASGGWFYYYCVSMPASHGIAASLIPQFFVLDATKAFALTAGSVAFIFGAVKRRTSAPRDVLFACQLGAALFASGSSRLHIGGWPNVLMFFSTFACVAFAVVASRLEGSSPRTPLAKIVTAAALLQLGAFAYDPTDAAPTLAQTRDAAAFALRVRSLEARGEVLVVGRGHLTTPRHYHAVALEDVLRMGNPVPADLSLALREKRYVAVILDDLDEISKATLLGRRSELFSLVGSNYFVALRMDDRARPPVTGWEARPSWVLRPRKATLEGLGDDRLDRRLLVERGLAEMRMRAVQAGARREDDGDDIEEMAAAADPRAPKP